MKNLQEKSGVISLKKFWSSTAALVAGLAFGLVASGSYGQNSVRLQAENMDPITSSSATKTTTSNGMTYVEFTTPPTIQPQWIQFSVPAGYTIAAGKYNMKINYKNGNNRGVCQVSVSNDNGAKFVSIGDPFDEYADVPTGNGVQASATLYNVSIPANITNIKVTTTSKNDGSSAYGIVIDYFNLDLISSWVGTTDAILYANPLYTKIGIGTPTPSTELEIVGDGGTGTGSKNLFQASPTRLYLFHTPVEDSKPATLIDPGNISLSAGMHTPSGLTATPSSLTLSTMYTNLSLGQGVISASSVSLGSFKIDCGTANILKNNQGGTTIDGGSIAVLDGDVSNYANSTKILPTKITLGQNVPAWSPMTEIDQGKINLFGAGLNVSGQTSSFSNVQAGIITAATDGGGTTTIFGGRITLNAPSANTTVVDGNSISTKSITADVVYVGTNGWSITAPDYVFNKDYKLMPLCEVEKFVAENKHLPDMPGATEMEKQKSVNLVEMNMKFLKKIEELTLHSIAQEKRVMEQEKRIEELQKKIGGK